jgi:type IV secretion system protein VirB2
MRNIFKTATGLAPLNSLGNRIETQEQNKRIIKAMVASTILTTLLMIEPAIAGTVPPIQSGGVAATLAGDENGISKALSNILTVLTGTFGQAVAILAVVVMGFMAMFGKLAWDHAMKVILGIAIVFGAATIIDWVAGTTG